MDSEAPAHHLAIPVAEIALFPSWMSRFSTALQDPAHPVEGLWEPLYETILNAFFCCPFSRLTEFLQVYGGAMSLVLGGYIFNFGSYSGTAYSTIGVTTVSEFSALFRNNFVSDCTAETVSVGLTGGTNGMN